MRVTRRQLHRIIREAMGREGGMMVQHDIVWLPDSGPSRALIEEDVELSIQTLLDDYVGGLPTAQLKATAVGPARGGHRVRLSGPASVIDAWFDYWDGAPPEVIDLGRVR